MTRRRVLLTIAGLGSVVTLLGLAGLIAPFTDRATTGTNSIESGAWVREVDLQVASADPSRADPCGEFTDDLATGLITASDVQPGAGGGGGFLPNACLLNAGSSSVSVWFTALDLSDVDTACTGDEAAVDTSCGNGGAGELSSQLTVGFEIMDCAQRLPLGIGIVDARLDGLATGSSVGLVTLAPGQVACLGSYWNYSPLTDDAPVMAQTDQATWRFAFDGATP